MNGLKYDLKLNFIEETNVFQIVKNVMNLYFFRVLLTCLLYNIYCVSFENQRSEVKYV